MEREMPHIPNDIIVEILSWVSAKRLLQLRWACKYWFNLITRDPGFIKMHLNLSTITTTTHDDDANLMSSISSSSIVLSIDKAYKLFQCSLDYNDTNRIGDISSEVCIALPYTGLNGFHLHCEILGSCNGLILLDIGQRMIEKLCVWNPCTKEYRNLPHLDLYVQRPAIRMLNYGFGYDHTADDYKVIIINSYYKVGGLYSDVHVYMLGTNSWRVVFDGPDTGERLMHYRQEGLFVNGALYWGDRDYRNIISFDIETEKLRYGSTTTPNFTSQRYCWGYYTSMQLFEGSLSVVLRDTHECLVEIWVMKDYVANNNKNESLWTKLATIHVNQDDCWRYPIKPLRFTRNGEILMVTNKNYLHLYDPKNKNVKIVCKICEHPDRHYPIDVYTESLVSLNSGTYMQVKNDESDQQQQEDASH